MASSVPTGPASAYVADQFDLSLSDVYRALAYCYDHVEETEATSGSIGKPTSTSTWLDPSPEA